MGLALRKAEMWTFGLAFPTLCLMRTAAEKGIKRFPASVQLFKVCWFVGIVIYEYYLCFHQVWWPKYIGGGGASSFWDTQFDETLDTLYQLQLAYHVQSAAAALVLSAKLEMHLHHAVTLALILSSYLTGYVRVGALVFFLHDVPDISSALIKGAIALKSTSATVSSYLLVLLSWGYCRLYMLSCLVYSVFFEAPASLRTRVVFGAMLSCLLLLHCYWYMLFFVMLGKYMSKGKVKDISETEADNRAFDARQRKQGKKSQ